MHVKLMALALLVVTASPAAAQLTLEQARATAGKAPVVVVIPGGTWRGQLVDIDDETVTILPKGGPPKTIQLTDVLRIESKKRDSLANGAIIGALITALWCSAICGQGLDSTDSLPAMIVAQAVVGAAIGAGIDAGHTGSIALYKRPKAAAARKSSGVFLTVRF